MYSIDNTSADGLWLRHGDLLGAPRTLNRDFWAIRCCMFISYYEELINGVDEENCHLGPAINDFARSMRSPGPRTPSPVDFIGELMDDIDLCD